MKILFVCVLLQFLSFSFGREDEATLVNGGCPKGAFPGYQPGQCFKISKVFLSFALAQVECQKSGGTLASVHDDLTNKLLAEQALKLTFIIHSPVWLGGQKNYQNQWQWTDGSNFSYTNWGFFQPNIFFGNDCLLESIVTGQWFNDNCLRLAPFVCEFNITVPESTTVKIVTTTAQATESTQTETKRLETTPGHLITTSKSQETSRVPETSRAQETSRAPETTPTSAQSNSIPLRTTRIVHSTEKPKISSTPEFSNATTKTPAYQLPCLNGWAYDSNAQSCYYVNENDYQKFIDGESYCQAFHIDSHLASIHSMEEDWFILSLHLSGDASFFWIGLYATTSHSKFIWTDGSPVDFTFFAQGKPDNDTNANCVGIVKDLSYQWSNRDCNSAGLTVCKMPAFAKV